MTTPLDEIQWKSPEWIQQFGLHTANVLDYFAESPFYDRTSNNQVLRMQFQFHQPPPHVHPQTHLQSRLAEMVGTEFVVAFVREPDFWVIRKQRRRDRHSTATLQDYYIIGANIYQSPKTYDLLSARLASTVLSMKKSLSLLHDMSSFSIADGAHTYPSETEPAAPPPTKALAATVGVSSTPASATPATGAASAAPDALPAGAADISPAVYDTLLASVRSSGDKPVYIDELPMYGKGSTVEQLGVKLNLADD